MAAVLYVTFGLGHSSELMQLTDLNDRLFFTVL